MCLKMSLGKMLSWCLLSAMLIPVASGLKNGFDLPQLGWNSWNHYGCGITEKDVMDMCVAFLSLSPVQSIEYNMLGAS